MAANHISQLLHRVFLTIGHRPKTSLLRKEVIQPQVPLRLPCYDFTPVTNHSLGACLLALARGVPIVSNAWIEECCSQQVHSAAYSMPLTCCLLPPPFVHLIFYHSGCQTVNTYVTRAVSIKPWRFFIHFPFILSLLLKPPCYLFMRTDLD